MLMCSPTKTSCGSRQRGAQSIPNYDLVKRRGAYSREQAKLRAKIDDFFQRTELKARSERDLLPPYRYESDIVAPPPVLWLEERTPAAKFYQSFGTPLTRFSREVHSPVKATTRAYKASHPDKVHATDKATQTNPRLKHHALGKPRVRFFSDTPYAKQRLLPNTETSQKIEDVLDLVIRHLSTEDLLVCRQVSRGWKLAIERPQHWLHVELKHASVPSGLFEEMAGWCSATQSISLQALAVTPAKLSSRPENLRGQLELGFDKLLKACSKTLKVITVVGCDNVLTDRVLWLASTCSFLEVVAYIAASHVTLPEALWSLGAGCRRVKTLIIPPLDPRKKQGYAGHRVCQIVGKCWPQLRVLCVGGRSLSLASICCALRGCVGLESFEIDRGRDIEDKSAEVLLEAGLKRVKLFYLTHTVISAAAVVILQGGCPMLKEISVILQERDFGTAAAFEDTVTELELLQQRQPFDTLLKLALTEDKRSEFTGGEN